MCFPILRLFRAPFAESLRRAIHLPRAALGMTIAHFGLAISVAGIAASAFEVENLANVKVGSDFALAGYSVHYAKVERLQGPNFIADHATLEVSKGGSLVAIMTPERRYFALQDQTTGVTAIRSNVLTDLYFALGDPQDDGSWTIRGYYKPLISFIWLGALIMAFGGMVSLSDRRWRVGAAARARMGAMQPAAGE